MIFAVKLQVVTVLCRQRFLADIIPVNTLYLPADFPAVSSERLNHHIVDIHGRKNREHKARGGISLDACGLLPHHRPRAGIRHQNDIRHNFFHNRLMVDSFIRVREHHLPVKNGIVNPAYLIDGLVKPFRRHQHLVNRVNQVILPENRTERRNLTVSCTVCRREHILNFEFNLKLPAVRKFFLLLRGDISVLAHIGQIPREIKVKLVLRRLVSPLVNAL